MKRLKILLTMILILELCAMIQAQDKVPIAIVVGQSTKTPIMMDGTLNEEVWQQGEWYTNFTMMGKPELVADAQTRFKMAFDRENLYIGAILDEPNMEKVRANITGHDGPVFNDDCLEFMLDPQGDRTEYFHFIASIAGATYDSEVREGGGVNNSAWDCPWSVVTARQKTSWSLEVRVPLVYLGLTEESRGDWALNVARERHAGVGELSSFTYSLGGFHQPSNYAKLQLPGAKIGKYLWNISSPFGGIVLPEGKQLFYSAKIHMTNETGAFQFISILPSLQAGEMQKTGKKIHAGLDAGQSGTFAFSVPLPATGRQMLYIKILDRRNPQQVLAVKMRPVNLNYSAVTIDVTKPNYRQTIYATQQVEAVEATVHLAMRPERLAKCTVSAVLMTENGTKIFGKMATVEAKAITKVKVPIPTLGNGKYSLKVSVAEDGKIVEKAKTIIWKLPPPASGHEWRLNENNVLLRDGKPYLVYGWFSDSLKNLANKQYPYTVTQHYGSYWWSLEKIRNNLLDPVNATGKYITIYPYPHPSWNKAEAWQRPLTQKEKEALRQNVQALKGHPAIFAWYLADEPELRPALPERMRQIYEVIAKEDPYHPQIMLNDTIAGIYKYADYSDILMPDPYPLFIVGKDAAKPIGKVSKFMQACQDAGNKRKGIMITPQGFNLEDYGRLNNRAPNFTEIRNQVYQAVVNGGTGFLWFKSLARANYPDMCAGVDFCGFELKDLQDAVFSQDVPGIKINADQPAEIQASLRQPGDDVYLFVVNTATQKNNVLVQMPAGTPKKLWVVSENRSLNLQAGALSDRFEKYETHIYTNVETLSKRPQLGVAMAAGKAALAAMKKPGNLAFKDSSVEVTTSDARSTGNARLVDGAETGFGWRVKTTGKSPDWVQLKWPETKIFGRVVVYTSSIENMNIQVPDKNVDCGWRTVAVLNGFSGTRAEISFDSVTSDTVRVVSTKIRDESHFSSMYEVEVYDK